MEKPIINFSEFFKADFTKLPEFNKEEFKEFIAEKTESIIEDVHDKIEETIENELIEEDVIIDNFYSVYKDKSEDFSCDIAVEGANLNDTEVRLILESDDWTLMFKGDIDKKGKCIIPMKKLNILEEGVIGKIKLEVIADGSVFTPWENDFKVKLSKKVTIKINENKPELVKPGVKVNFKK